MQTDKIRLIEELAANAWQPEMEQHFGGWRMRATGGSSRRVNSVWPNRQPAGEDIDLALDIVEDFYRRRENIPRFQICPAALPEDLPQRLADRGYTADAHTTVRTAPLETVLTKTSPPACEIISSPTLTERWFKTYVTASEYSLESYPIRHEILMRVGPPANFLLLCDEEKPLAVGLGVAESGWLGVFCVVTAPPHRRKGSASAVMNALAEWGQSQSADQSYLQVMDNNPPALRLYDQLGYEELYQYYYSENRLDEVNG